MFPRFLKLLASVPLALGCAGEPDGTVERTRGAIVGGERSDDASNAVVHLRSYPPDLSPTDCSGTLIAANLVITALHCVAHRNVDARFSCNPDGSVDAVDPDGGSLGVPFAPELIEVRLGVAPPEEPAAIGELVLGSGSNQICRNDLAFIVLDRPLDVAPVSIRLARPTNRGETLTVMGYGSQEIQALVERFQREGVRVIDVGPEADSGENGTAAPRTLVTNAGPCHGDSGGPAFSSETGALVGVYSLLASASCQAVGVRNVFTRLPPFESLVAEAFEAAGATPLLEPAAPPEGGLDPAGGSGSGDEPHCACRAAGIRNASPAAWFFAVFVAAVFAIRSRKRR